MASYERDRLVGQTQLALLHLPDAPAQGPQPIPVRPQVNLPLQGVDRLGPHAQAGVEPGQGLERVAGRANHVAVVGPALVLLGAVDEPLVGVDRLVGPLQAVIVEVGQLLHALAAGAGRGQRRERARGALLEQAGQVVPALLLAEQLLEAAHGRAVVGLEQQDRLVALLGALVLLEGLVEAGHVVVEGHRLLAGGHLGRPHEDGAHGVPAVLLGGDAAELPREVSSRVSKRKARSRASRARPMSLAPRSQTSAARRR